MTVMEKQIGRKCGIKRLDKCHYVNVRTGEVCEFHHSVKNQDLRKLKEFRIMQIITAYTLALRALKPHLFTKKLINRH